MTERSYYDDSYRRGFSAKVVELTVFRDQPAIILDHTYFYPDSGGQPHDHGTLNGAPVKEVIIRESDHQILHVLESPVNSDVVEAEIDWTRRFDHMQQHTGQHILSGAFLQVAQAETIGFHLGNSASTIDLDKGSLPEKLVVNTEKLANQIVWEDRPVIVRYSDKEELTGLNLRKTPDRSEEKLRLVDIQEFDLSACGGTHVRRTGEIGIIKITRLERRGENLRVEFLCGGRALDDYHRKARVINDLMAELTTAEDDLPLAVDRMKEEVKFANRQLRRQTSTLIQIEADKLLEESQDLAGIRLIVAIFEDRDPQEVRTLAKIISKKQGTLALLGIAGSKSQLVFVASDDVSVDMGRLLKSVLPILGTSKGGGSSNYAQGGGPPAPAEKINEIMMAAREKIMQVKR